MLPHCEPPSWMVDAASAASPADTQPTEAQHTASHMRQNALFLLSGWNERRLFLHVKEKEEKIRAYARVILPPGVASSERPYISPSSLGRRRRRRRKGKSGFTSFFLFPFSLGGRPPPPDRIMIKEPCRGGGEGGRISSLDAGGGLWCHHRPSEDQLSKVPFLFLACDRPIYPGRVSYNFSFEYF